VLACVSTVPVEATTIRNGPRSGRPRGSESLETVLFEIKVLRDSIGGNRHVNVIAR